MPTTLFLEPHDTALFRDGRPFEAGGANLARGTGYLPPQRTVYVMLRTALLEQNGIRYPNTNLNDLKNNTAFDCDGPLKALLGSPLGTGTLQVYGPILARRRMLNDREALDLLFPPPADVLPSARTVGLYHYLTPTERSKDQVLSNLPEGTSPLYPWPEPSEAVHVEGTGWVKDDHRLTHGDLKSYLLQQAIAPFPVEEWVRPETHTGIKRSRSSRTAESGKLFSVEFLRTAKKHGHFSQVSEFDGDVGWLVDTNASDELFADVRSVNGGGERRPFSIRRARRPEFHQLWEKVAAKFQPTQGVLRFRLYLLTPACFDGGWRPELPSIDGIRLAVKGAAITGVAPVSGWRLSGKGAGTSRPSSLQVPAGSVYFVEATSDLNTAKFREALHDHFWMKSLARNKDERQQGFGLVLTGVWK